MWRIALPILVATGTACTEPCLQLAYNVCMCQPTTFAQQQCDVNAQDSEARAQPSGAQMQQCQALLPGCNIQQPTDPLCTQLTAPEVKRACGMARESPDGGVDGGTTDGG